MKTPEIGMVFKGTPQTEQVVDVKVTVTDKFGATATQYFKITVVSVTNIVENNQSNVLIYPNPAKDIVNISIQNILSNVDITIFDASGKVIYTKNTDENETAIDVSNFASGMYIIEIKDDVLVERQKFIIK